VPFKRTSAGASNASRVLTNSSMRGAVKAVEHSNSAETFAALERQDVPQAARGDMAQALGRRPVAYPSIVIRLGMILLR
jgi:hypothetical protein